MIYNTIRSPLSKDNFKGDWIFEHLALRRTGQLYDCRHPGFA